SVSPGSEACNWNLVGADIRAVSRENVRALVANVSGLNRHFVRQLVLHGGIVSVHGRQRLLVGQHERGDAVGQEELTVRRQRGVRLTALIRSLIEAEEGGEGRSATSQGEGSVEVAVVD